MAQDLARWLHKSLLSPERQAQARTDFEAHPMRILVLDEVFRPKVAERLFQRLEGTRFIQDFGLYAEVRVSEEVWAAASSTERFYRYGVVERTGTRARKKVPTLVGALFDLFESEELRGLVSRLTGMPLGHTEPANLHAMGPGDYLRPHNDRNDGRKLAMVAYLSKGFQAEWGGSLRFLGTSGMLTVEPRFNRLVIFDVNTHVAHHIDMLREGPPERRRFSAGTWFHEHA